MTKVTKTDEALYPNGSVCVVFNALVDGKPVRVEHYLQSREFISDCIKETHLRLQLEEGWPDTCTCDILDASTRNPVEVTRGSLIMGCCEVCGKVLANRTERQQSALDSACLCGGCKQAEVAQTIEDFNRSGH